MEWISLICGIVGFFVLAYHHASLRVWVLAWFIYLIVVTGLETQSHGILMSLWILSLFLTVFLNVSRLRYRYLIHPVLKRYRRVMPTLSKTEREALAAGTVGWEGQLFAGNPCWEQLLSIPCSRLSPEEQAFIDGPVERLCSMINDWEVTHHRLDLPPAVWQFIKDEGFFGLIIPKKWGGKEFSAYAHSQILIKIYGRSTTLASTVSVPNSLGPAELLLHYGTQEQKEYYLPRLAKGLEVPCFALTGPNAGSDASAMTDTGIVCQREYQGKMTLGIRLNWNKRYITLAPIATVIGLAFKLYDPEHWLGAETHLGITCALIPRETPGISIGRRHLPCNIVFQNGPIQGKDVFIPLDWVIGGPQRVGQGWHMLMECLAAGRAISLPASSVGGAKVLSYSVGAYARIRRQFKRPIGDYEGVQAALARIAGLTYLMDATRTFTADVIDTGEKPAVASAITKYHVTECGRQIANDGMDVQAGKAICLGPNNYLGRFYQSLPISITVEGANILTRNMIIFGQGIIRCHPYLFKEYESAQLSDETESIKRFDQALWGHLGFILSVGVRSFLLSMTHGRIAWNVPTGKTKGYFQQATRFSAVFALLSEISLICFGGSLKRRENLSARLGDIVSYLYLLSAILRHYHRQKKPIEDFPFVQWAADYCLYAIQNSIVDLLRNFTKRWLGKCLEWFCFPWGKRLLKPRDALNHQVAQLILSPTEARLRLAEGAFLSPLGNNPMAHIEDALHKVIAAEPIEALLAKAKLTTHAGQSILERAKEALSQQWITESQYKVLISAEAARQAIIAVDDFSEEELRPLGK